MKIQWKYSFFFFRTCLVTLICLVVWDVFRIILQAIIIHWMRRDRNETLVRYRQNITRSQNTNRSNNKIIMEKTSTVYSSGASLGVGLLGPWITKILAFNHFLKNHFIFWFRQKIHNDYNQYRRSEPNMQWKINNNFPP